MDIAKSAWRTLLRGMRWVGDIISTVILGIFYFTIFGLFALVIRQFAHLIDKDPAHSSFLLKIIPEQTVESITHE